MSLAAHRVQPKPSIRQAIQPAFFSASINKTLDKHHRGVTPPPPIDFNSTSTPVIEWVTYPTQKYLRLRADHTENGLSRSFEIVFYKKLATSTEAITADSDLVALTYYSDPINGLLHVGVSGTLALEYNEIEGTLSGTFEGLFDHGGEDANREFPITGKFFVNYRWTKNGAQQ